MFKVFFRYRALAFSREIALLSQHLKQLLGMLFAVLYTALPGIVLLVFLGLGKIIKAEGGSVNQLWIAWCFLAVQTIFFYALQQAILNIEQRCFQLSIACSRWWMWLADCRNLLFTHVFLWCSVFLLLTMSSTQLSQNTHFMIFTALQLGLGFLSLYRMQQTVFFCLVSATLILALPYLTPLIMMLSWVTVFIGCIFIPTFNWQKEFKVNTLVGFWFSFYSHHYQILFWRLASGVVVTAGMLVLASEREDFTYLAAYFSCFIFLLLITTLHIEVAKITAQFRAFFHSLNKSKTFNYSRIFKSVMVYFILLVVIATIFTQWWLAVGVGLVAIFCFYIAEKKPERLALVWMCFLVGGLFI
ncbi:DUF6136 family protein [Pseudoalteromonas tunicata]|uniref:DUF6136 family protein n=1 Tax=Pseudoalteromonas tunicata TaxID=314281 RepID=UPI00273F7D55|nr:DUF6136 family protein [Pseudoalteromonas tunicata]MDP4982852.1 DUF6136 family protein [Pseudoalteromonas tunicata]